jgi:hypothetical protein
MMFSQWRLHRKVFLLSLSYDSTFLTSVLKVLKMSSCILFFFSDVAEEFSAKAESSVAVHLQEKASPEFTRDLELTILQG